VRTLEIQKVESALLTLRLRTTFRTHWKSLHEHRTLLVRIQAGGLWGEGEAYSLEPEAALREAQQLALEGREAWLVEELTGGIENPTVRSAVDLASHDLLGKAIQVPVHVLLGLAHRPLETCRMLAAARRWWEAGYPILKIKLTTDTDLGIIEQIRKFGGPALRIWVDANQAYEPRHAVEVAQRLSRVGVEIFEQPLPVGRLHEYAAIHPQIPMPIILDEEIRSAADVVRAAAAGGVDGINVKLAKFGGIWEGLRGIHVARAHGMSVMLGCYFESSLGISASAHLLALADRIDLDAPLFLEEDPYEGLTYEAALVNPPVADGLGVRRRPAL
jgi:L-alanine-DL-glutamate epimerase-like enolase superfamily enzyme